MITGPASWPLRHHSWILLESIGPPNLEWSTLFRSTGPIAMLRRRSVCPILIEVYTVEPIHKLFIFVMFMQVFVDNSIQQRKKLIFQWHYVDANVCVNSIKLNLLIMDITTCASIYIHVHVWILIWSKTWYLSFWICHLFRAWSPNNDHITLYLCIQRNALLSLVNWL